MIGLLRLYLARALMWFSDNLARMARRLVEPLARCFPQLWFKA